MHSHNKFRRRFVSLLGLGGIGLVSKAAQAGNADDRFETRSTHQVVYQCNKADNDYFNHILFSVGEMIRKYGDDIQVVVAAFGPGLQLLGENPTFPVKKIHQQRVQSLDMYGVEFHACANTMKSLGWKKIDLLDMAMVVPVGVDDIMQLQEAGYSYIAI